MNLYWVSLLIQNDEHSKPWLCAMTDGSLKLEEAMQTIEKGRKNYRVLAAWIDTFDDNKNKTTVFHECYVDCVGNVEQKK